MVAKGAQNSGRMKACSHVRGLIEKIEICNLCFKVLKQKHIARSNVSMNNRRLDLLMKVLQSPGSINSNLYPLEPAEWWTRLRIRDTFLAYNENIKKRLNFIEITAFGHLSRS